MSSHNGCSFSVLLWLSLDLHCAHDVYIYIYIYIYILMSLISQSLTIIWVLCLRRLPELFMFTSQILFLLL
jgi:hypothetical protein